MLQDILTNKYNRSERWYDSLKEIPEVVSVAGAIITGEIMGYLTDAYLAIVKRFSKSPDRWMNRDWAMVPPKTDRRTD